MYTPISLYAAFLVDTWKFTSQPSRTRAAPPAVATSFSIWGQTMLTMVFKLCLSAEKRWRRLQGYRRLGEVIENVKFINGVREDEVAA